MYRTLTGVVLVLALLAAVVAFASPQPQAVADTSTAWSAPQAAPKMAAPMKAAPKSETSLVAATKAVPQHEQISALTITGMKKLAADTDVGTGTMGITATQAMLATSRPAGETTFTAQAALDPATRHVWISGAYTFTWSADVADVGRTMAIATTAPPTTGGQYIGDTLAVESTPHLTAAGTLC